MSDPLDHLPLNGNGHQRPNNQNDRQYRFEKWSYRVTRELIPWIESDKESEMRFRPAGSNHDQLELSFSFDDGQFIGYARVEAIELSLQESGLPADLWFTLLRKTWAGKVVTITPLSDNGVSLQLQLQNLSLYLPFENQHRGNRPLQLDFYEEIADKLSPDSEANDRSAKNLADREIKLNLGQIKSFLDEDANQFQSSSFERPTQPPPDQNRKAAGQIKSQPFLNLDDHPYENCVEITIRQASSSISSALFKRSLARAARCDILEIVPLAMVHTANELIILVQLPDHKRHVRLVRYFAIHQEKLGDQMRIAPYIELNSSRRWVWRQLATEKTFELQNGRLHAIRS